jgi:hypothetical protein
LYFEFFAKPYDAHTNPGEAKGVLFDTCRTHFPDALHHMVEKQRVSAFDDRKDAVRRLSKGDTVFYSHASDGVVAAAKVTSGKVKCDTYQGCPELYLDVQFLVPAPTPLGPVMRAMPFPKVKEVTGKSFFWARILKVPYLSADEAAELVSELQKHLAESTPQTVAEPAAHARGVHG